MPTLLTPQGKREGGIRASYENGIITREEDWHFQVRADSLTQDRGIILFGTPGLPIIGQTIFNGMLCKAGDAVRLDEDGYRWNASFTFTNAQDEDSNQGNQNTGDPALWIPVRRTLYERIEEVFFKDINGKANANSAGEAFETGLPIGRKIPIWEFTQWESASITDETIIDRNETVNSAAYKGKAAKTLLLTVVDSVLGFYYGYRCRMTTYRLAYNVKKWTLKRLDVGYNYKDGDELLPWVYKGNTILGPLDGSGGRALSGALPGVAATLEFDIYASSSFSFLRI